MSRRESKARVSWVARTFLRGAFALLAALGPGVPTPARADTAAPDREPRLEDFARAIDLTPTQPRAVHTALLPIEVYRGVTRADLGDLRVFNAGGQPVPHALRTLDAPDDREDRFVDLRFFPIESPARTAEGLESLTLHVRHCHERPNQFGRSTQTRCTS